MLQTKNIVKRGVKTVLIDMTASLAFYPKS